MASSPSSKFLAEVAAVAGAIDPEKIEALVHKLDWLRADFGRLFILGVGGSAGNAGHMVNDMRKLCGIEAYAPTDNVSELTARTNDDGWHTVFYEWLLTSRLSKKDALFILSVGGGNAEKGVSMNLVNAVKLANGVGAEVYGVVGRHDGYAVQYGSNVIVAPGAQDYMPELDPAHMTPLAESFQAVVWHCLVSHPRLQLRKTTW